MVRFFYCKISPPISRVVFLQSKISVMDKSIIPIFKLVALLEGLSYILLLFVAVPIKYLADDPTYVKLLGMPHGILFIIYIVLALLVSQKLQLSKRQRNGLLLASVIPFGTFFINKRYLS